MFDLWLNKYLQHRDNQVYRSTMRILDRPMTDIYADELCNPNFQITSAPPTSTLASPQNDVFSQRLQAANSQHLSASNTPSREQSPFRQGSPLAPSGNNFGAQSANLRFGTATQQQTHLACYQQQPAILQDPPESTHVTQPQGNFNAVASSVRQIPQRHPSVPLSSVTDDFPATLTSKESSSESETPESKKPSRTSADTGTYTCTFHGCTLRFETPAKLQQHKRDCHRKSAVAINGGDGNGMTSAAQRSSQAGPHKVRTASDKGSLRTLC